MYNFQKKLYFFLSLILTFKIAKIIINFENVKFIQRRINASLITPSIQSIYIIHAFYNAAALE